jgi:uncharacterized RDD family membrane protein YckC
MRDTPAVAVAAVLLALATVFDDPHATRDGPGPDVGPLGRLAGSLRNRMLDVVGPDEIVERVDMNAVLARVDIPALLDRVDVDRLLQRVDVNALLDRIDIDVLLARVDMDTVLSRMDVNALLDRVDVDALAARLDIDAVMDRVDIHRLVERAGIADIVAESTGTVAESVLDMLRRQLLGLDVVVTRGVMRLLSRDEHALPAGPQVLAGDGGPTHSMPVPNAPTSDVTGHYAGPVTRLVAYVIDTAIAGGAFTIVTGALGSALGSIDIALGGLQRGNVLFGVVLVAWFFAYWWASTAVAGRTPGMALVGLRIVTRSGEPITGRHALLRVLTLPLSFAVFGLGLLGIVFDRERRGLHDVAAGSTVVYDWGDRRASMPTPLARWLQRHAAPIDPSTDHPDGSASEAGRGAGLQ